MSREELEKIRQKMKGKGITLQQVADRCGCRATAVHHVLRGNSASARILSMIHQMLAEKEKQD